MNHGADGERKWPSVAVPLSWSSSGRPSVCDDSCGLGMGINKEQPSHSSSSFYLSASLCFCVFHLYIFLSIHQDFSISLSQQRVKGSLWSPSGIIPSQQIPLDTPRAERVLLSQLDSSSPESKLCLSLADPPGGLLLFGTWLHPLHKVSHPADLGRWMAIGEPLPPLCELSHFSSRDSPGQRDA